MSDFFFTKNELAEFLNVRPETIVRWTRERKIPHIRISPKIIRYDLDDVIRCLKEASRE